MATVKLMFRPSCVKGKSGVICYQLCYKQENRQITTDMRIPPDCWDGKKRELVVVSGNESIASFRIRIERDMEELRRIIRELENELTGYSLSDVIGQFRGREKKVGVLGYLKKEIDRLRQNGQYGTARNYQRTWNSFSQFLGQRELLFSAMDSGTVCLYEQWLHRRKIEKNSCSFYMRVLRAVYNKAVKEGLTQQCFPFKEVYTGIACTKKRSVDEKVILKLQRLDLASFPGLALSRDLFIFSYCARGMAFVDIAYLKKRDVVGEYITYCRRKTGQRLTFRIEPCLRILLERYWKCEPDSPYLFPIIKEEDEDRAYRQYQTGLNYHNRKLKRLGELIGETLSLSSYTPRHSWATTARNHNVPVSVISAGMGHTSEKTTLIYLASLDNEVIDNANKGILKDLNDAVSI